MRDLLSRFSERLRETRSSRTTHTYGAIATAFVAFIDHELPKRQDVEAFLGRFRRSGRPASASARNQELAALRALARVAARDRLWVSDPTAGIPFVREPRRDPAVLTTAELRRVFEAAGSLPGTKRHETLAILALLSQGGLRVHELVALDVRQVDLVSATLVGVAGKGGTIADVPMNLETVALLTAWLEVRARVAGDHEPGLFVSSRGSRLSSRSVQRLVARLRNATGTAKRVTPHTFRHTAATLALTLGCDLATVGDVLRHADLNTTRRYIHLVDERRREAVRRLGGVIPRAVLPSEIPGEPLEKGIDVQYPLADAA
ncbi:MAG: hypothetical protein AMXMBFR56_81460 [Polyangiaceae bacterium]